MTFWAINICLTFVLCAFLAGVLIPQILLISYRRKLYDEPGDRKIHYRVVPRLGGIAFKPVIVFAMVLLIGVNYLLGRPDILMAAGDDALALAFGFCAILMLYLIGMADDLIGVRYRAKFVALILCGAMLIAGGVWIDNLCGILEIHAIPAWVGYPLSILLVVFIINSINLIDGIDGLASGLSSVALLFYGLLFFFLHKYIFAMLAFATLGVLAPFFYYNVFGNAERHKKIFMGDTGSLTIGLILCFLSIKLCSCIPDGGIDIPNPLIVAFSPLIIPCFDTLRVFMRRIRTGKNPFLPDMNHIHHKMLKIGMPQRRVMITILSVSMLFTLSNALLSAYVNVNLLLIGDGLVWIAFNVWWSNVIKQKAKQKVLKQQNMQLTMNRASSIYEYEN